MFDPTSLIMLQLSDPIQCARSCSVIHIISSAQNVAPKFIISQFLLTLIFEDFLTSTQCQKFHTLIALLHLVALPTVMQLPDILQYSKDSMQDHYRARLKGFGQVW